MERLTERIDNVPDGESGVWVKNHDYVSAAEKLAEYEDLEEQGNLLRLPCRLGDTVYILNQKRIIPLKICEIYFDSHGIEIAAKNREELGYRTINLTEDGIGVEWYKTKEEAEKSIKETVLNKSDKDLER